MQKRGSYTSRMAASACHTEAQLAVYRSLARWPVRHVRYHAYQVPEVAGRIRVVSPRFIRHSHAAGLKVYGPPLPSDAPPIVVK